MVTSPEVSWLFFKAREKRPYLCHTGRASNAEKQPTGPGSEGCVGNGPAAALLVGYVSIQICALLAPCRRPILNGTTSPLFARRCTSSAFNFHCGLHARWFAQRFLSQRDSTIVARHEVPGRHLERGTRGDLCPEGGYRAQPRVSTLGTLKTTSSP